MKHGKKPTYEQRKVIAANGYDTTAWLVVKDTPDEMVLTNRHDGQIKTIHKG